jgi:anhydro-N-acetylmuramic acid kinase
MLCIGLMSGTSLDGVDAVLADISELGVPTLLGHEHLAFAAELRQQLMQLQTPAENELHRAALAANALVQAYHEAVQRLLKQTGHTPSQISAIAAHGQTVRHRPDLGYTWQLNNPALLAELSGIDIIADFRSRDLAAGGQGAPLTPAFHEAVWAHPERARLVVNLGGIANVTHLIPEQPVLGYDLGPANILLDAWIHLHLGQAYDKNGAWASMGETNDDLLQRLLNEPFFAQAAPKSTGRDWFHLPWLKQHLQGFSSLAPEDVQRTLVELTARLITKETLAAPEPIEEVVLCGGGAYNLCLLDALRTSLPGSVRLLTSADCGLAPEQVEALAFAWLGWCHWKKQPSNLPEVTGARGLRVLGARYPR